MNSLFTNERISIEFWDPDNPMKKSIVDRVDLLTYRQLAIIADYQRSVGKTELKIRRAGQFRPSGDELEGTEAYYVGLQEQIQNIKEILQEIRADAADLRRYLDRMREEKNKIKKVYTDPPYSVEEGR
uniref:Uncharacterized protein n=1 Tax=viral metagenome TaxID=1070528 RepID=A0A6M3JNM0_9ZZZZ